MKPYISVIIPTYNRKHIILEAIKSVLQQEPKIYEVIIVDDGSIDQTAEYLRSLNLSVKVIRTEHVGCAHARNTGIKKAVGQFIAFLDSDDLLLPGSIQERYGFFLIHPDIMLVYTDEFIESSGKRLKKTKFNQEITAHEQKITYNLPNFINPQAPLHTSSVMIRKSLFSDVGYFNEDLQIHVDSEMWNRISEKYIFGYIEKPLSVFRWEKDPEHILKAGNRKQFIEYGRIYLKIYERRRSKKGLTTYEKEAIIKSYNRLNLLDEIVNLREAGKISEDEFHNRRQAIFEWFEYK